MFDFLLCIYINREGTERKGGTGEKGNIDTEKEYAMKERCDYRDLRKRFLDEPLLP